MAIVQCTISLHDAVEKTEYYPIYDVAFTKTRHQHDGKYLANAEGGLEQKGAGRWPTGRSASCFEGDLGFTVACIHSLASKQNPTRLRGKWMHNPMLIILGRLCVFIPCNLVQITVQQMKRSLFAMSACKIINVRCRFFNCRVFGCWAFVCLFVCCLHYFFNMPVI